MSFLFRQFSNGKKITDHPDNRPIVFINANFSNCDSLIQQVIPEIRVIVISPQANGIREISCILNSSCCREMYIICQGSPGCLHIGNTELSLNTLIQYSLRLQSWFNDASDASIDSPRLYLYGCNVAAGDVGEEFITKLSSISGATIAASARVPQDNIFNLT
ncbi:MAG: DUF4347 domain-containing protein [Waterburya sp.]